MSLDENACHLDAFAETMVLSYSDPFIPVFFSVLVVLVFDRFRRFKIIEGGFNI